MLEDSIKFTREIEKLKGVERMTRRLSDGRRENDAEHSFHVALMAHVLAKYADRPVNADRVCKMLLIHDVVEIDAGDTFAYDVNGYKDKEERETKGAHRLFGLLGEDKEEYFKLWREFEDMDSDDSLFANGLDRLQPMMLNYYGGGGTWKSHHIPKDQVLKRLAPLKEISTALWQYGAGLIENYYNGK